VEVAFNGSRVKAKRGRAVMRDRHEPARERMRAKMQTDKGRWSRRLAGLVLAPDQ
jgi:hypothetical protein